MNEVTLANAELVLRTEVVRGRVTISGSEIVAVEPGGAVPVGAIDCAGDYLAPGLIELHTDNLERHMKPRPKVKWPHAHAIMAHDRELAGAGITTVFDALRVGSFFSSPARYAAYARGLADEILAARAAGQLKISHHIHLRAEVCSETLLEEMARFGPEDRVGLVSLMDHTPGQRQFRDISKFEAYIRGKHGISEQEFEDHCARLTAVQARLGAAHEAGAVAEAKRYGAVLASHDDTTVEQVRVSAGHGIKLAEFPTTEDAAQACRDAGIAVIMGAPNVIRGGSHSGNVAAEALAQAGLLDILSSDYVPSALLNAAVALGALWGDMARGLATVTSAPAEAVGLKDRGRIAEGARADLIRFRTHDTVAGVQEVYAAGHRVA